MPKRVLQSLDFTVNRVLMKLFKSSNIAVIEQCRYFFHIELPSVQLERRFKRFLVNAADEDFMCTSAQSMFDMFSIPYS